MEFWTFTIIDAELHDAGADTLEGTAIVSDFLNTDLPRCCWRTREGAARACLEEINERIESPILSDLTDDDWIEVGEGEMFVRNEMPKLCALVWRMEVR